MQYLSLLESVYEKAALPVFIANSCGKVLWSNGAAFPCDNLSVLFDDGIFPAESGIYSGLRGGSSSCCYRYHLLECESDNENYTVLEVMSLDVLSDLFKLDVVRDGWTNYAAVLRQAAQSIYNEGTTLYAVLDEAQYFEEMDCLNVQMGDCYKILKANLPIGEIMKYSFNIMAEKAVMLAAFLRKFSDTMKRELGCAVRVSADAVAVYVDEERLTYAIINGLMLLTEDYEGAGKKPSISLHASEVSGDVLLSICIDATEDVRNYEKIFSPIYRLGDDSTANFANPNAYALLLFCKRFGGVLYRNGNTSIGIRLPKTDREGELGNLHSHARTYDVDRFSPLYVAFANMFGVKFF